MSAKTKLARAIAGAVYGIPVSAALFSGSVWAEQGVFNLGQVVVSAEQNKARGVEQVVDAKQLEEFNRNTVGSALNMLPGFSLATAGARGEQQFYVRGFDSRQVPIFLDGIPQYVPYDGNVDIARFTTFDLAEVRLAKGSASLLYGPNIMGGAVNLVSRKPVKELEGNVRVGFATGSEHMVAANVGMNQGLWYMQAGVSYLEAASFKLPHGFTDHKAQPTDTGSRRSNADYRDKKGSFKFGLTPNDTDEYAIGYSKQEGDKNQPVYTGANDQEKARFWRWPQWDKESIYFISSTALDEHNTLKTRVYKDEYVNTLRMYDNSAFTTYSNSPYTDKTYGAAVEWINTNLENHELHIAVHYKDDRHKSADDKSSKDFRDVTRSIALEDLITLAPTWRMRVGVSHEERSARKTFSTDYPNFDKDTTRATNGLLELMHDLNDDIELFASVAKKTRMPTLKDRFSARMGKAYANPNLKPEEARHVEFGLRGTPWAGAYLQSSIFYSHVRNEMQFMPYKDKEQLQNVGKARHRGFEISLDQNIGEQWQVGAAYTYLNRVNLSDRSIKLTDTPRHKLFAHTTWKPMDKLALQATMETESGRRISYKESKTVTNYPTLSGFTVLGFKSTWYVLDELSLEAGVRNLTNKNYAYADGYPMPGRTWFAGANYQF